jgi:hypothetical protein
VRYGFSRFSDDLTVKLDRQENLLVLAPESLGEHTPH